VRSIQRSRVEPNLVVVDKDNGGKADALNVALNVATGDLVCAIDADTIVSADALQHLVTPFVSRPDTVAVGGTVRLVDGRIPDDENEVMAAPRRFLLGAQTVEYVRAFLVGRLGWNPLGGNLVISGAFGLFDRERMIDISGYNRDSIGEDMELVVRLRRAGYEQGRVALVHVKSLDVEAQRIENAQPADAQNDLLLQPVGLVASIEAIRDAAVGRIVLVEVRVEQENRHFRSGLALVDMQPRADPYGRPPYVQGDHRGQRSRPMREIPWVGHTRLNPVSIKRLLQISLMTCERYENDRERKVCGRLHGVARQDTEPAGIGVHLGPEGDLHR